MRETTRLARELDVETIHPFAEPDFVSAFAAEGGIRGFASRSAAMEALFGEVLPRDVRRRSTKASFDSVLWNRYTRAFVEGLNQDDLDAALHVLGLESIVDRPALAAHWSAPAPLANSFLLLQACWLALSG